MNNPYQASQSISEAELGSGESIYQPQFFSLHGRIGRLRYLGYLMASYFLLGIALSALTPILLRFVDGDSQAQVLSIFSYVSLVSVGVVFAKRRFNDMDYSGWLSLLFVIPYLNFFIGLMLVFKRGSDYKNQFGKPPAPNKGWIWLAVLIIPGIFIIGILAAVALPAYQTYTKKAKQAQQRSQQQPQQQPQQIPAQSSTGQ